MWKETGDHMLILMVVAFFLLVLILVVLITFAEYVHEKRTARWVRNARGTRGKR